jgi:uncharacterized protein YbjQ (UPF0145 family)
MIVVTTENIKGYKVNEVKGQVFGVVVRSRGLGGNIIAALRSLVGGEIKEYTALLEDARKQATDRMVKNAQQMGANAVIIALAWLSSPCFHGLYGIRGTKRDMDKFLGHTNLQMK